MKEQQVDEVFLPIHFQPELAADEGKQAAHLPQEVLDTSYEGALKLSFGVGLAQFQEVECVFVLHSQFSLGA